MGRHLPLALIGLTALACGATAPSDGDTAEAPAAREEVREGLEGIDPDHFAEGALADRAAVVPCTLASGEETSCVRITLAGAPANHEVGPFCPRDVSDGADAAGIWLERGEVWDLTGEFITNLATFYDDERWQLYDPATGAVRVTDTREACEAAARPDVDARYENYCVECALEDLGGGIQSSYLIPTAPVRRSAPEEIDRRSSIGVSLSGVVFDPPAPTHAILAAHTIAAFDDCGGHVNPHAGYHYHAATGCSHEVAQPDGHAPLIGYALDGFAMHAMRDGDGTEPGDLDVCRGHEDDVRGYHYHVASAGENMFIGCFMGEVVQSDDAGRGGPPGQGPPGQGPPPQGTR